MTVGRPAEQLSRTRKTPAKLPPQPRRRRATGTRAWGTRSAVLLHALYPASSSSSSRSAHFPSSPPPPPLRSLLKVNTFPITLCCFLAQCRELAFVVRLGVKCASVFAWVFFDPLSGGAAASAVTGTLERGRSLVILQLRNSV